MIILSIFQTWRYKMARDPTGWGSLLLFASGLIVLLVIMSMMPYAPVSP